MKTEMTVSQIRGLLLIAPKFDVRYYLNGVLFDDGRAIVTNGHSLVAVNLEKTGDGGGIVPRSALETISKGGKVSDEVTITIDSDGAVTLERDRGKMTISAQVIDGRFPDYWGVIPDNPSGELAQFDPELLSRTHKALVACTGSQRSTTLAHNGSRAALMFVHGCGCKGIAAIMPWRVKGSASAEFLEFKNRGKASGG